MQLDVAVDPHVLHLLQVAVPLPVDVADAGDPARLVALPERLDVGAQVVDLGLLVGREFGAHPLFLGLEAHVVLVILVVQELGGLIHRQPRAKIFLPEDAGKRAAGGDLNPALGVDRLRHPYAVHLLHPFRDDAVLRLHAVFQGVEAVHPRHGVLGVGIGVGHEPHVLDRQPPRMHPHLRFVAGGAQRRDRHELGAVGGDVVDRGEPAPRDDEAVAVAGGVVHLGVEVAGGLGEALRIDQSLRVEAGEILDHVPVGGRDRREVGLAVADGDAVLGGHAPDAVHGTQVLGESVVGHEGERDLVGLAVAVGVAVAEGDQHVAQLPGGGGNPQPQRVQPALVDHVVLLQVVGLQEQEPGQRLHLPLGVEHVGQRLRLLGEDAVQVGGVALAEVRPQVGHHALLQQLGDQVLLQAADAEHQMRVVIGGEHDRHLLDVVDRHEVERDPGRLLPALDPRVVVGVMRPTSRVPSGHQGDARLHREDPRRGQVGGAGALLGAGGEHEQRRRQQRPRQNGSECSCHCTLLV